MLGERGKPWTARDVVGALKRRDGVEQLLREGRATTRELGEVAAAWREWAADPDGWISVPHGELLATVGAAGG